MVEFEKIEYVGENKSGFLDCELEELEDKLKKPTNETEEEKIWGIKINHLRCCVWYNKRTKEISTSGPAWFFNDLFPEKYR